MISVQSVYESVKNLANKDQKGFVTYEIFNSFAKIAQQNIFKEMFQEALDGKKLKKAKLDADYGLSFNDRAKKAASQFLEKSTLSRTNGAFSFPSDVYSFVSVTTRTVPPTQVDLLYDEEQVNRIVESTLSAPTEDFPIALVGKQAISMFPTSISRINVSYYRTPQAPSYQIRYVQSGGVQVEIFDPTLSKDFELPKQYEEELVYEIAKMVGVNIKEQTVQSYGELEDNKS